MASNEHTPAPTLRRHPIGRLAVILACAAALSGCSVIGSRKSPILDATEGSPTVLDIYRGQGGVHTGQAPVDRQSARDRLRSEGGVRPLQQGDGDTQRYWSATEPLRQRFARVPNPDLVMVVFPHMAKGKYPVPGYVTVFPMYEQAAIYALPGEVERDLLGERSKYAADAKER